MLPLERLWSERNRNPVLAISGVIILVVALIDWRTKPFVSLGFLYLFPIMFAAGFLPRWLVAALGIACAVLAEEFSALEPSVVRLSFEGLALAGCGLFVHELAQNRRLNVEVQAKLKALVDPLAGSVYVKSVSNVRRPNDKQNRNVCKYYSRSGRTGDVWIE